MDYMYVHFTFTCISNYSFESNEFSTCSMCLSVIIIFDPVRQQSTRDQKTRLWTIIGQCLVFTMNPIVIFSEFIKGSSMMKSDDNYNYSNGKTNSLIYNYFGNISFRFYISFAFFFILLDTDFWTLGIHTCSI